MRPAMGGLTAATTWLALQFAGAPAASANPWRLECGLALDSVRNCAVVQAVVGEDRGDVGGAIVLYAPAPLPGAAAGKNRVIVRLAVPSNASTSLPLSFGTETQRIGSFKVDGCAGVMGCFAEFSLDEAHLGKMTGARYLQLVYHHDGPETFGLSFEVADLKDWVDIVASMDREPVVAHSGRDRLRIVGASAVYPFTLAVAEQFGKSGLGKMPVVESTGTGGGLRLFCAGVGERHPDIANAARRISPREFEACQKNGVKDIIELKIGFESTVLVQGKGGTPISLAMEQAFLALADQVPNKEGRLVPNPHRMWSDVDASLPNVRIEVVGPPPTSSVRDSFHELFMEVGARRIPALAELARSDRRSFDRVWQTMRKDGAYIEGDNNAILERIKANKHALGVFGFSFLEQNTAELRGVPIDGVEPSHEAVSSGRYKGGRPLFVYVKRAHIGVIPGVDRFVSEFVSAKAMSADGYLARLGLVALPESERAPASVRALHPLDAREVQ